jgi:hypothetical protein
MPPGGVLSSEKISGFKRRPWPPQVEGGKLSGSTGCAAEAAGLFVVALFSLTSGAFHG